MAETYLRGGDAMNIRDLLKPGDGLVTGICWYSAEQWARLREVASDRGELEETHEEWAGDDEAQPPQLP